MPNRLAREASPYLLQHQDNPVDWFPWGDEALALARAQDKPILLSIGYSACHWCHVMAHESFENPEIARLMNELFVNIKVDREERPDLDALYMLAVQLLTGQGGWPMTVFLTPDGKPFYGGTYFPPEDRGPMAGFPRILVGVAAAYQQRRNDIDASAEKLTEALQTHFGTTPEASLLGPQLLDDAARNLARQYDPVNGGFGGAPKFPPPMTIEFLLRVHARTGSARALEMAEQTLNKMARGGLYDQIGGGFHRYAVDAIWLVPHFEKMLYDNAQLAHVYTLAWQLTGEPFYRAIATETLDYVLREMTSPEGGFYATQDADSEGHEGKFYVWSPAELRAVLGDTDGDALAALLGATERGNFEGSNVLSLPRAEDRMLLRDSRYAAMRQRVYAARAQRVWPGRDDKILTAWNGMLLRALATAAWVFDEARYAEAARANARFLLDNLLQDGKLLRNYKDGAARLNGYLEDYTNLVDGLLALYTATFEHDWVGQAVTLADTLLTEFYDDGAHAFYDTGRSHEQLITRPRDAYDSATPSGNSVACDVLLRLSHLTGNVEYARVANAVLTTHAANAAQAPHGYSRLLCAVDLAVGPTAEVAIVGVPDAADTRALVDALRGAYLPRVVVAVARPDDDDVTAVIPLLRDRPQLEGRATAYVCLNYACRLPTTDAEEMLRQIEALAGARRS